MSARQAEAQEGLRAAFWVEPAAQGLRERPAPVNDQLTTRTFLDAPPCRMSNCEARCDQRWRCWQPGKGVIRLRRPRPELRVAGACQPSRRPPIAHRPERLPTLADVPAGTARRARRGRERAQVSVPLSVPRAMLSARPSFDPRSVLCPSVWPADGPAGAADRCRRRPRPGSPSQRGRSGSLSEGLEVAELR